MDVHCKIIANNYNDGRLYQVTVVASPSNQVFTYTYDAAGRVSEIQYPTATGVVAKFSDASNNSGWDANGRLLHLRYLKAGNLLQGYQYSYDASGNRTQMVEQPSSGPSITWDYGYDWLDRLISVKKDTVTQSLYSYDESDNRVELQWPVLSQTHAYAYNDANQLTSRSLNGSTAETFSHDADGNMIARTAGGQTTHYRWDAFDKLTRRQSASLTQTYGYDAEGLRSSTGTTIKNYHSGGASLADQRPSGSISFLQGHQLLGMKQDGDFYWYLPDHLGSVRQVIDSSGAVVATTSLDEFGRELASSGSADRRLHTYTGSLGVRHEDGLYLAGQRWFDPGLGRWLNPDPIGFAGGLNLYEYAKSSPVNYSDPSGLEPPEESDFGRSTFRETVRTGADGAMSGMEAVAEGYDLTNPWNWVLVGGAFGARVFKGIFRPRPQGLGGLLNRRRSQSGFAKFQRKPPRLPCPPKGFTGDEDFARRKLGLSKNEFNKRIHILKEDFDNNQDVWINPNTGEVLHRGSLESLGNLKDL